MSRGGGRRAALVAALWTSVVLGDVSVVEGQAGTGERDDWQTRPWVGDLTFLGANALSSAVSAGLLQRLRGGSFADGFSRGALGGAIHYGGMRVGTRGFDGAGLLGRQLAAVGGSVVRNASDGIPSLERLMFPFGPVHLYVRLADRIAIHPKVNLSTTIVAAIAAAESNLEWDAGATLSAGAPVFRSPDRALLSEGDAVGGMVFQGNILISDVGSGERDRHVFAHERAHILQQDWRFQVWSDPAEAWLINKVPGGNSIYRIFDLDFLATGVRGSLIWAFDVPYDHRLYELEADFLADR